MSSSALLVPDVASADWSAGGMVVEPTWRIHSSVAGETATMVPFSTMSSGCCSGLGTG